MTKDQGNLAVVKCIYKIDRTERWLRNCGTEGNITTFCQDASDNTIFKRRFDLKAIIGTREFAYINWMLMEPDELMTKEQLPENLVQAENATTQQATNTNQTKRDAVS